jgi:metal-dependent amidase/aminoacylase/carboxypeptidase family protein
MDKSEIHILPEIREMEAEIVENRRWFHARPERGFEEFKTSARVAELLQSSGITELYEGIAKVRPLRSNDFRFKLLSSF